MIAGPARLWLFSFLFSLGRCWSRFFSFYDAIEAFFQRSDGKLPPGFFPSLSFSSSGLSLAGLGRLGGVMGRVQTSFVLPSPFPFLPLAYLGRAVFSFFFATIGDAGGVFSSTGMAGERL